MSSNTAVRETAWSFMYGVGENTTARHSSMQASRYARAEVHLFPFRECCSQIGEFPIPRCDSEEGGCQTLRLTSLTFRPPCPTSSIRFDPRNLLQTARDSLHHLDTIIYNPESVRALSGTVIDVRSANACTCCVPVRSCSSLFFRFDPCVLLPSLPMHRSRDPALMELLPRRLRLLQPCVALCNNGYPKCRYVYGQLRRDLHRLPIPHCALNNFHPSSSYPCACRCPS